MAGMDQRRSCQVDATSPVQCAVYAPDPTYVDLRASTAGLQHCRTGHRDTSPCFSPNALTYASPPVLVPTRLSGQAELLRTHGLCRAHAQLPTRPGLCSCTPVVPGGAPAEAEVATAADGAQSARGRHRLEVAIQVVRVILERAVGVARGQRQRLGAQVELLVGVADGVGRLEDAGRGRRARAGHLRGQRVRAVCTRQRALEVAGSRRRAVCMQAGATPLKTSQYSVLTPHTIVCDEHF